MRARRLRNEERGSVVTLFAVAIPIFILLLALALDIGNWYVHKERLQTRADDASFAAALAYGYRFPDCTADADLGDEIAFTARQYAGDEDPSIPAAFQPPFNTTIDDATTTDVRINAFNPGGDHYSDAPGNSGHPCFFHPDTNDFYSPDGGYWTDVKAREVNVASLFGGFGVPVPAITTAARVGLSKIATATAVQPFAVADAADTPCAWARFVEPDGDTQDVQLFDNDNDNTWTRTDDVTMPDGGGGVFLSAGVVLGSCSSASQRTFFPDLGYVQAWTNDGVPRPESINLSGGSTCNGSYIFREGSACSVVVDVRVVFANSCPQPNRRVWAYTGPFSAGSQTALTRVTPPPFSNDWTGTLPAITPGQGLVDVGIAAQCIGAGPQQDISETPPREQRVMAGNDLQQGPIRSFTLETTSVNNNDGGGPDNGPTDFSETITLVLDPLHSDEAADLRSIIRGEVTNVPSGAPQNGFLAGAVNCGASGPSAVGTAVTAGCNGPLTPPTSMTVMATSSTSSLQGAYNTAWCNTTNNWGNYPNIPRGDRRLIVVGVTTPGAPFSRGTGDSGLTQSITRFAGFYVTGWMGQSASCAGNDAAPPAIAAGQGALWGHFVKFVRPPSTGTPAASPCTWIEDGPNPPDTRNDVEACIATLVR